MTEKRHIRRVIKSRATIEGAGVHLRRAIGFADPETTDPFLLLDDFRSDTPAHYLKGFPWHPHRGIETITYVLRGDVEHGDSLGNSGVITSGDVQWMTAGSGIIHQEMPKGDTHGSMHGFQLWANLPAADKMMSPRYRSILAAEIPEVVDPNGARIKIIAGQVGQVHGPVRDVVIDPEYLDVTVPPRSVFVRPTVIGHTVFAFVIDGRGIFGEPDTGVAAGAITNGHLVHYADGDAIQVVTADEPVRFLLFSGRPIREPIAWSGPIVMNTQEELDTAYDELRRGTFIKAKNT